MDDEPQPRHYIRMLLASHGYRTRAFSSAREFLVDFEDLPGCLVCDYLMEGMSGLQLQDEMLAAGNSLPIVFVSGYADVSISVRAMRKGAVTLLEKPVRPDDLLAAVSEGVKLDTRRRLRRDRLTKARHRLAGLSERERPVVDLILAGKSNKQVAFTLGIGLRTVERRRQAIFSKTGVESAVQLADLVRIAGRAERASN
jgi:FixJ family two-component response regulator